MCCDSWGHKESDTTERLTWTELNWVGRHRVIGRKQRVVTLNKGPLSGEKGESVSGGTKTWKLYVVLSKLHTKSIIWSELRGWDQLREGLEVNAIKFRFYLLVLGNFLSSLIEMQLINETILYIHIDVYGLPRWLSGKESACQWRKHTRRGFDPWVGKISWRRKWQSIPVFLPGKSHEYRNLVGYSPYGHKESDITEHTHTHIYLYIVWNYCK